ncbi:MAG TPA: hydroxylase, partial [Candidatus Dormibacteraeota bacterium]
TVFLDNPLFTTLAARSIADSGTIRLPFGTGGTSPIASDDVARVVATILTDPGPYIGRVFELTGPRSQDMNAVAEEYARALSRPVSYVDVPWETWAEQVLAGAKLGPYVDEHLATMARLHRENRYDRMTATVEEITGRPAESVEEFIAQRSDVFAR